ncbi:MAG: hypothetical protein ACKOW9_06460 [Candidatus Paceibacterota bacterium]
MIRVGNESDLDEVFKLESEALGEEVCWAPERTLRWIGIGAYNAVIFEDGKGIASFVCSFQITREAYEGIVRGSLLPEDLDVDRDGSGESGFFWIGLALTRPDRMGEGLARLCCTELVSMLGDAHMVADVYSDDGRALAERFGWVRVGGGSRPTYVNP